MCKSHDTLLELGLYGFHLLQWIIQRKRSGKAVLRTSNSKIIKLMIAIKIDTNENSNRNLFRMIHMRFYYFMHFMHALIASQILAIVWK